MSYCRFGEADAYVYPSRDGIICCWCNLGADGLDFTTNDENEMIKHLRKHQDAGDFIPERVFERLQEEWDEKHPA